MGGSWSTRARQNMLYLIWIILIVQNRSYDISRHVTIGGIDTPDIEGLTWRIESDVCQFFSSVQKGIAANHTTSEVVDGEICYEHHSWSSLVHHSYKATECLEHLDDFFNNLPTPSAVKESSSRPYIASPTVHQDASQIH